MGEFDEYYQKKRIESEVEIQGKMDWLKKKRPLPNKTLLLPTKDYLNQTNANALSLQKRGSPQNANASSLLLKAST